MSEHFTAQAPASPEAANHRFGKVYLVGGGPGDPELLTLRAARLLREADTVVYDNLVSSGVMEMVNGRAERIYVGKQSSRHTLSQTEINQLLVDLAHQGKNVVRLKGGDPFVFGRGGEELEVLVEAGIAFEVVPGITAASGISCYAGIPLTHRDHAQSCIFTTGHLKDDSLDLDWETLARPRQTVVIYMGLAALPVICRALIAHGQRSDMPVAVIERGTQPQQRVITGTLTTISALTAATAMQSPSLIIVGDVVRLHQSLHWFAGTAMDALETV
jgi:uroporphyrin-III C-methyltransferase